MQLHVQNSRTPVGAHEIEFITKVSMNAPKVAARAQRLPLNIGLVIDRSGSMGQIPMEHAKAAAIKVVERLQDFDYCTVVIFDTQVDVLADVKQMSAANKRKLIEQIQLVYSRGSTDLHLGWSTCVERQLRINNKDLVGRVFLLSDGHANHGITNDEQLSRMAAKYHQQGISTSTFGIGDGYNEMIMSVLANHGEGNTYYISQTRHIEECFSQELAELFTTAVRHTVMQIETPIGYAVSIVGDRPHTRRDNHITINFGTLMSEEQRDIYLHVKALAPQVYGTVRMPIAVQGIDHLDNAVAQSYTWTWEIVANVNPQIDDDIERKAADLDVAALQQNVMQMHRRHHKDALVFVQQHALAHPLFNRFGVYDELMAELNRPWDEDDYKMRAEYSTSMRKGSSITGSNLEARTLRALQTGNMKEYEFYRERLARQQRADVQNTSDDTDTNS